MKKSAPWRRRGWRLEAKSPLDMTLATWAELAPELRQYDEFRLRKAVAKALSVPREKDTELGLLLPLYLEQEFGPWIDGWHWAANDGGLVSSYCCPHHTLFPNGRVDPEFIADRVVEAVCEWREVLSELDDIIEPLSELASRMSCEEVVEVAATDVLEFVLRKSDASDMWRYTFADVLIWALERAGFTGKEVADAVANVADGRFESWIAPDTATTDNAIAELKSGVGKAVRNPGSMDSTMDWVTIRPINNQLKDSEGASASHQVIEDGHTAFILAYDEARDPVRADRMRSALKTCREDALSGEPLNWAMIARWQGIVLGVDCAEFRSEIAWAKGGRERYGLAPNLKEMFEDYLRQATDDTQSAFFRAARAYFDTCFVHPFEDGNGRAARLLLDFILTRAGLALQIAGPVFVLAKSPNTNFWRFLVTLEMCSGKRAQGAF